MVSGKEVISLELADGLVSRGADVTFAISYWNNGEFPRRLAARRLESSILPLGFLSISLNKRCLDMTLEQCKRLPALLSGYRSLVRNCQPDGVIHTNWHHLLLLLPLLSPERDIFWIHEVLPNLWHYRFVIRSIIRRLRVVVCVSHAVATALLDIGIPRAKILVIYNGIRSREPAHKLRAHDASPKHLRVGIVGQVGPWKGHDDLLEAFALIPGDERAELHIFGNGSPDYEIALKAKTRRLGLESTVKWRGYLNDREQIYKDIDVCVVPSRLADPLPTSAIEAGLYGIPCIVSESGGLPEIVRHGVTGQVVQPNSPRELADALILLLRDTSLRIELGSKASVRVRQVFGVDRFIDEFLEVLEQDVCRTVV